MGGTTNRFVAAQLANPSEAANNAAPWASFVNAAHTVALNLQQSFTNGEHNSANLIAPRGSIIIFAGDPSSASQDFCPTLQLDVKPPSLMQLLLLKASDFSPLASASSRNGGLSSPFTALPHLKTNPSS
jgi:hypothetical protein